MCRGKKAYRVEELEVGGRGEREGGREGVGRRKREVERGRGRGREEK